MWSKIKQFFFSLEVVAPAKPVRKEVGIADQIAIRSYVLGKNIGKVGEFKLLEIENRVIRYK